ncbi:MAG: GGDEF domain-containing protein [Novosphingobium sp. PASSN1]|nr:MAG: GGDEF domain-containing protein [Novosphingobium sp. PASSN1]
MRLHAQLRARLRAPLALRTRVALLFALLLIAVMAVSVGVASSGLSFMARQAAERDMAANARVFDQIIASRSTQLGESAAVVARDFGFREAFATGDSATLASALASLGQRTGAEVAAIVALDGTVTAAPGAPAMSGAALLPALEAGRDRGTVALGGKLALAVAAPIEMPDLAGWLVLAQPLSGPDIASLSKLSAIPMRAEVSDASALAPALRREQPGIIAIAPSAEGDQLVRLSALPSLQQGVEARLVLRSPLAAALEAYARTRFLLIAIAIAGTLLGVWLALRLAADITRPLTALADAARRIAKGEWTRVPVRGDREVAALAHSFNAMVDAIDERERQIVHTALHDGLTGMPNRSYFIEKLERALLRQNDDYRTLVAFIDLDDFKVINDTMGHPAGDALLRRIAKLLQDLYPDAMVARFGGDEFGLLITGLSRSADCTAIASALNDALNRDHLIEGRTLAASASFGVAISPADGADCDTLLKHADLALYRAKAEGKGTYHFFEAALDEAASRRRQLELDMREALRNGAFELHFQPLFSMAHQRVKGFEALMRWNHPVRGAISPAEFIPLAEETGLIIPLGEWALMEACHQASAWPDDLSVAVNISPRQFASPALAQAVIRALAASGLDPSQLELEITESIFIGNVEKTVATLHALRGLGIRVSLDDFGTGYSSLSYLRSFPFDKIKIDQSFVRDLCGDTSARAIVRAITAMAGALGMDILAEGVELDAQADMLRAEGCDMIQGYLISRPIPAREVAALLGLHQGEAKRA